MAGLAIIIGAGLFTLRPCDAHGGDGAGLVDVSAWPGILSAALLAVFAFIGFEHLVNISEEMKDQRRTLPLALFITLG